VSEIRRAIVKSYDASAHAAAVQIAGSLAVWLDAIRVATNIPPADVATGRQCTVLFLDPSNQDDAVIIAIQGALPSVGEILIATSTADLTLTTTAQSITGDGDSSKVRLLLPTPGDWLIEAVFDFVFDVAGATIAIGQLYLNDSGSAESGTAAFATVDTDRATVAQHWKVTTTTANTPVELKALKVGNFGTLRAITPDTRLAATGVKRSTGGSGVSDHGALTGLADDDHTQYQKESEKGAANGYAPLDGSGLILDSDIPAAIARDSELHTVDDQHSPLGGYYPGVLSTGIKTTPQVPYAGDGFTITGLRCRVAVAASGADLKVKIRRNGVSLGEVNLGTTQHLQRLRLSWRLLRHRDHPDRHHPQRGLRPGLDGGAMTTYERVIKRLEEMGYDDLQMSTNFANDLNADSLDQVDIIMQMEEEFGEIDDPDTRNGLVSVGHVVRYIDGLP